MRDDLSSNTSMTGFGSRHHISINKILEIKHCSRSPFCTPLAAVHLSLRGLCHSEPFLGWPSEVVQRRPTKGHLQQKAHFLPGESAGILITIRELEEEVR